MTRYPVLILNIFLMVVSIALAFSLVSSKVLAQSPKTWVKLCEDAKFRKDPKAKIEKKKICLTHHERLDSGTGLVLMSVGLREIMDQGTKRLMIMVPHNVTIPPGVQVRVDKEKPIELKYSICHAAGCTAEISASKEMIAELRKGKQMTITATSWIDEPVVFLVPLAGFDEAFEGSSVDSEKKYQEEREKLMFEILEEKFRKRKHYDGCNPKFSKCDNFG